MSAEAEIRRGIQKLSGVSADTAHMLACTVDAVDISARTCDVTTINGTSEIQITGVQLMAGVNDGWLLQPTVGSEVRIAYSKKNLPYVSLFSQLDGIFLICGNVVLNDGSFGGLVQIANLTAKLNNLVQELTTELGKIAAGIAAGGGSYSPTMPSNFSQGDYENTQIKHGKL